MKVVAAAADARAPMEIALSRSSRGIRTVSWCDSAGSCSGSLQPSHEHFSSFVPAQAGCRCVDVQFLQLIPHIREGEGFHGKFRLPAAAALIVHFVGPRKRKV